MKLRCSQLKCIVFQTEVTKNICCHFRNCHPCGWVTARRVEGGYPKYQRWPGAVKMRRGDFHESCVAGAGCCQAPPSSYLPSQHLPPAKQGAKDRFSEAAQHSQQQHSSLPACVDTLPLQQEKLQTRDHGKTSFEFAFLWSTDICELSRTSFRNTINLISNAGAYITYYYIFLFNFFQFKLRTSDWL